MAAPFVLKSNNTKESTFDRLIEQVGLIICQMMI